ncbi:MAG: methylenetetrahydrofolate reductase C-terminal domain-containing protein [Actinomycetota bacterium]|nr:methylenetetrahydrofolate reductase C-terminal domain-containing protein [Actinomycetota bacterium]MDI6822259.1 methylenetetrahydrofolate reductase C-terminal domain-containing protein [Actinomycetota bacterium]
MIVTKQKPLEEILNFLKDYEAIFLIGCRLCAAMYDTGGLPQVKEMGEKLKARGKTITGFSAIAALCHGKNVEKELSERAREVDAAQSILVLACGEGVQVVSEISAKSVYPALDTLFLGGITENRRFEEHCSLCGECILNLTGGICPVTRCAKGILNGPCGGVNEGKCEVGNGRECVWVLIHDRLKSQGKLDNIKDIFDPKDFSKALHPHYLSEEGDK